MGGGRGQVLVGLFSYRYIFHAELLENTFKPAAVQSGTLGSLTDDVDRLRVAGP